MGIWILVYDFMDLLEKKSLIFTVKITHLSNYTSIHFHIYQFTSLTQNDLPPEKMAV